METIPQYNLKRIYKVAMEQGFIDKDISYNQFATICREFCIKLSKAILNKYRFNTTFGSIGLLRSDRRGKSIDWNASKKRRDFLISEGKTPFNKLTAPQGEHWFIYHEGKDYYTWNWFKPDTLKNLIGNLKYYVFKAASDNRKAIGKTIKADEFADLNYSL